MLPRRRNTAPTLVLDTRLMVIVGTAALLLAALSFLLGRWSAGGPEPAGTVAQQTATPPPVEVKQRSIEDDLSFLNRVERDRREGEEAVRDGDTAVPAQTKRPMKKTKSEPAPAPPPVKPAAAKPKDTSPVASSSSAPLPADGSGYLIQVFASEHSDRAEEIRARLAAKGYPVTVVTTEINAKTYYRVRVGPYAQKSRATTMKNRLEREESLSTWIIRP